MFALLIRVFRKTKYEQEQPLSRYGSVNKDIYVQSLPFSRLYNFFIFSSIFISLFFSSCSLINFPTGSVEGYIYEQTVINPKPLQNALVSITGSTNTALTDEEGYFYLDEVNAGIRDLTVTKEEYQTLYFLKISVEENLTTLINDGNPIIVKAVDEKYLFDSGVLYYNQESYQDALNIFQQFTNEYPDSSYSDDVQYYFGWCFLSLEDYSRAIEEWEKLLFNYPESIYSDDSQYFIGWCYEKKLGLYIQASLAYYSVLINFPDSQWADDAQLGIGNCYYLTLDFGNAIKEYQKVIDYYPLSDLLPVAQYSLAQSYRRAKYLNTAIAEYEELILLYPDSEYCGPSQYYIGYCHYEKDDFQTAIDEFNQLIEEYPKSIWPGEERKIAPSAQYYIGWCYEKLELWEEALAAYQVVINDYPNGTWSDGSSIPEFAQDRIDWILENHPPEPE